MWAFVFRHLRDREVRGIRQNIEPQRVIREKAAQEQVELFREHGCSLPIPEFSVKVIRHIGLVLPVEKNRAVTNNGRSRAVSEIHRRVEVGFFSR
jgi:hypothetical protein